MSAETKKTGSKAGNRGGEMSTANSIVDDKEQSRLRLAVEKAQRAQRRALDERKKAPAGLKVGMVIEEDPRDRLRRIYVEEPMKAQGKDPHEVATYFDEPGDRDSKFLRHLEEGWEPVLNEYGEQVRHNADLMFQRPRWMTDEAIARASRMSRERMATSEHPQEVSATDASKYVPLTENATEVRETASV